MGAAAGSDGFANDGEWLVKFSGGKLTPLHLFYSEFCRDSANSSSVLGLNRKDLVDEESEEGEIGSSDDEEGEEIEELPPASKKAKV